MRLHSCTAALLLTVGFIGAAPLSATPIKIPWIKQQQATDCGPTLLASLAARNGGDVKARYSEIVAQDTKEKHVGAYSLGHLEKRAGLLEISLAQVPLNGAVSAANCGPAADNNAGLKRILDAHYAKLRSIIASGRPVIVPIKNENTNGHYLLLVDAGKDNFTIHDPAEEGLRTVTKDELARGMCGFLYLAYEVSGKRNHKHSRRGRR